MKYLPITLIVTLSASLVYALIFVPTLGALIAKPFTQEELAAAVRRALDAARPDVVSP